ncbi:hypothetical protein AMATHDRAFT_61600 [Amanita thiersii Skay4041]|uniref:Uncharacterized protein n=1 Tax=Amanita thiersii Skay4041 TaxID=703135 RepID=A0A2A9NR35_9AGAR|nr:hypothetical protein AMATHDRAFT_61600 [Amanita thiersii Skay4041]
MSHQPANTPSLSSSLSPPSSFNNSVGSVTHEGLQKALQHIPSHHFHKISFKSRSHKAGGRHKKSLNPPTFTQPRFATNPQEGELKAGKSGSYRYSVTHEYPIQVDAMAQHASALGECGIPSTLLMTAPPTSVPAQNRAFHIADSRSPVFPVHAPFSSPSVIYDNFTQYPTGNSLPSAYDNQCLAYYNSNYYSFQSSGLHYPAPIHAVGVELQPDFSSLYYQDPRITLPQYSSLAPGVPVPGMWTAENVGRDCLETVNYFPLLDGNAFVNSTGSLATGAIYPPDHMHAIQSGMPFQLGEPPTKY